MVKKKYIAILGAAFLFAGCEHELVIPVDYDVTLSEENTYKVGEPVEFKIDGDVDNIVFFSGEEGHNYDFRNRYEYSTSDIESIQLDISYGIWYGNTQLSTDPTQLEAYIRPTWDDCPVSWENFDADSLAFRKMVEDGMPGWEKLDYKDDPSVLAVYNPYTYNLDSKYVDGLIIAFHFIPSETYSNSIWRRFYNIYGLLTTKYSGATPFTLNFFSMSWQTIMFDTIPDAHYDYVANYSGVKIATSGVYTVRFDARKYYSDNRYPLPEGWAISKQIKMNKANPDTGESIKNLQNVLRSYSYVYNAPGTYKAVFVGTNRNFKGGSQVLKEVEVTIK